MSDFQMPIAEPKPDRETSRDREICSLRVPVSACLPVSVPARFFLLLTIVLLLAGCAAAPNQSIDQAPAGGGSFSPETVAQGFFDDLGSALHDQKLADDQQR